FLDRDLMAFEEIWAAAGTPDAVFRTTASELQRTTGAGVVDLKETAPGDEHHPISHGGPMIQLTESAAGKVKELLVEEGRSDIALRVAVQPGGCSGLRYAMYLDDQLTEKDVAEEQFGVRVVIDRMSVPYLSEAKIDFVD